MSTVNNGPQIVRSGLVLGLDSSARGSYLPNSLINMNNWTVGTGGVNGYNPNQSNANENQRFSGTNPWNETGIIWGSFPSGDGDADGGWVTYADYSIDKSKMYRFSVWVRRTSSTTGGTAYLGCTSWDAGQYIKRTTDSVDESNPYWYYANISNFTQNVWYLIVGHLYPFNTNYTGRHPDSGLYNVGSAIKVADIGGNTNGGDFKFASTSTYLFQRVFHYYCGDTTSRLEWYDPRIDLVNGKQPSITELVTRSPIKWKDLSGNNNNGTINGAIFNSANGGSILFDGTNDYVVSSNFTPNFSTKTLSGWVKLSSVSQQGGGVVTLQSTDGLVFDSIVYNETGQGWGFGSNGFSRTNWSGVSETSTSVWVNITATYENSNYRMYRNGILIYTLTSFGALNFNFNSNVQLAYRHLGGGSAFLAGNIANTFVYNRVLTATEVLQNYEATKTRFGL